MVNSDPAKKLKKCWKMLAPCVAGTERARCMLGLTGMYAKGDSEKACANQLQSARNHMGTMAIVQNCLRPLKDAESREDLARDGRDAAVEGMEAELDEAVQNFYTFFDPPLEAIVAATMEDEASKQNTYIKQHNIYTNTNAHE